MSEQSSPSMVRTYIIAAIPLMLFMSVALVFFKQLNSGTNPNDLPSVLINLPAPGFPGEPLSGLESEGVQVPAISSQLVEGKVLLVNIWASWCLPCRQEHPVLMKIAKQIPGLLLVGINYKDKNANALRFLGSMGNPYRAVSIDPNGSASIDWGVYGIPETFIINKTGTIIYKHVGPIGEALLNDKLLPIIDDALAK